MRVTDDTTTLPQYLTVAEIAEDMRVTTRTVYAWIDRGHFPALRLGYRTLRIPTDAYLTYKRQLTDTATERASHAPAPHIPGQTEIPA